MSEGHCVTSLWGQRWTGGKFSLSTLGMRQISPVLGGIDLPTPRMIAAARILLDITQRVLASEADVSITALARYESGATQLRTGTLEALLAVLSRRGIRFIANRDGIVMGVLVVEAEQSSRNAKQPKA